MPRRELLARDAGRASERAGTQHPRIHSQLGEATRIRDHTMRMLLQQQKKRQIELLKRPLLRFLLPKVARSLLKQLQALRISLGDSSDLGAWMIRFFS